MKVNTRNIVKKITKKDNSASLLICHRDLEKQLESAESITRNILKLPKGKPYKSSPDAFGIWPENLDGKSIKIEQIHEFIRKTQLKPFSNKFKVGVIISAEKMTKEAQNALLKTLEEPSKNTFLILTTAKAAKLLPTILSRCQVIELQESTKQHIDKSKIKKVLNADIINRFKLVEELVKQKNKVLANEEIESLIENLLVFFRTRLLKSHKDTKKAENISEIINLIEATKHVIDANVNQRLALENLMINLPLKGEDY